ncbi:MAG: VCBS repeat-containing protein, partial [Bacteroidota bacterium]
MSIYHHTSLIGKTDWGLLFLLVLLNSCQPPTEKQNTLFEEISSRTSGITFSNDLTNTVELNILNYLYFYNGGGVAVGDINNDSLVDIFFTGNLVPNRLYLNKGNFVFEDITEQAGILHTADSWSTGVTMADVNADGWLDIYVSQLGSFLDRRGRNQLFINQQDGTFKEAAEAYGLAQEGFGTQAAFFDFDQDGDLDVYQLNHSINPAGTVGDTIQRYEKDRFAGDRLLENVGGEFMEITEAAGIISSRLGYGLGIMIDDFNEDGLPDIYIANDFHE